ncbi:AmmeMemoRadiSam system protein B [Pseudaeromonas paramecii]|uniref:MEMO1 family protein GCM10023095_29610 n=1 Tax=Pseudaeromonas paramecii TaxID=2138166 RepID=A0ABP8QKI2_9GAMM
MQTLRAAAVAGTFYPANPILLREQITLWCREGDAPTLPRPVRALLLPHAGYCYSGAIAAAGIRLLPKQGIKRVLILCPAHHVYLRGMALSSAERFATPLGEIPLDRAALAGLSHLPGVQINDEAHRFEHAIEVQLPFLQQQLGDFSLLPVVVGETSPSAVAGLLEALMNEQTLLIISSDLSHYLSWQQARERDEETLAQILALKGDLQGQQACGCFALNGALLWARRHKLQASRLAAANSGDTAGDKHRVVGYAAIAFY